MDPDYWITDLTVLRFSAARASLWGFVMARDTGSMKKVAVLTGLTMLVGGAEISEAEAATTTPQTDTFFLSTSGSPTSQNLNFSAFNTALGTLTGVLFDLNSNVSVGNSGGATGPSATVTVFGQQISSSTSFGAYNFGSVDGTHGGATPLSAFTSAFAVGLAFNVNFCGECASNWNGQGDFKGLTLTYEYDPTVSGTPLPGALPLMATGLAGLGAVEWRRRRKQKSVEQA
jgi:hypothetical protein